MYMNHSSPLFISANIGHLRRMRRMHICPHSTNNESRLCNCVHFSRLLQFTILPRGLTTPSTTLRGQGARVKLELLGKCFLTCSSLDNCDFHFATCSVAAAREGNRRRAMQDCRCTLHPDNEIVGRDGRTDATEGRWLLSNPPRA